VAKHAWTILCEKVLQDSESPLYTFVDVYDRLTINTSAELPDVEAKLDEVKKGGGRGIGVPARIRLVTQWFRSDISQPEESKCRIRLVDPLGDILFEQKISIELVESPLQRVAIRASAINITVLGYYWWVVEKPKATQGKREQWTEVTRLPLLIHAAPSPSPRVSRAPQRPGSSPRKDPRGGARR